MGGAGYGLHGDTIACGGAAPVGFGDIGADNIVFRADKMDLRNCRNLRRDIGRVQRTAQGRHLFAPVQGHMIQVSRDGADARHIGPPRGDKHRHRAAT